MVTEELNFSYFTGYRPNGLGSFYSKTRPLLFLLPADGRPTLMVNEFMKGDAAKRSWVPNIRSWLKVPFTISYVTDLLAELGLTESKIGAELRARAENRDAYPGVRPIKNSISKDKIRRCL